MRQLLLVLFLVFTASNLFSQRPGKYKQQAQSENIIYGKVESVVKDKQTNLILPYANVSLFQNDSIIDGTITNESGFFSFDQLKIGDYFLEISYTGYSNSIVEFSITNKKLNKKIKQIVLESSTYILDNIELSDQAPVYENKIEKIVYNVENDLSQTANDGIDVLRNTPLVSVDMNDKVSMRGSQNIKFLLNGKTSSFLNSDNLTDVLQAIPAEQIKSIEVITSPTAKYDAEGEAGIINIITKQKNIQGFSAGVNTNTGTRVNRSSFNINYGKNRFGISASGGARYGWPREGNTSMSTILYDSLNNILTQQINDGYFVGNWVGFRGSVDLYYDINQYNSLTSNINIGGHVKTNEGINNVIYEDQLNSYLYTASDTSSNNDTETEITINYSKKFPNKEGQELTISAQYGTHLHDDSKIMQQIGYQDSSIDNDMYGTGYELTGQVDYIHPYGEENKIEIGLKTISRLTTNDYKTNIESDNNLTWLNNDSLTNILNYDQNVSAAYVSNHLNLSNGYGLIFGVRYEHTSISGSYRDYFTSFGNSYNNIVPSLIFSKKLNMFKSLKLSYVNRIQRPDIHRINSNIEISDLNNISRGNPLLDPSQTHQLEFGYNSFSPGLMTSFSLYYKAREDVIEAFTFLRDDNVFETNYFNTGNNNSIGFNFYGSVNIRRFVNIRASFDAYTYNMKTRVNDVDLERASINYNYMINGNISLGKGYKIEGRIFARSPRQTIQGERPSFSMMSFGFKKEFLNNRGSIGIGMIDPLSKYKSFDTEIYSDLNDGSSFETISGYEILFRSFNISFKYNFGQLNFDPIKKKASLENNDVLEEDGDGR